MIRVTESNAPQSLRPKELYFNSLGFWRLIPYSQIVAGISLYTYIYASTFGVVIRSLKTKSTTKTE